MFAFAIWDVATEELFLVRDRMGVKPLFYYPTADGVLFGSEPKAILAHPGVQPRVNKDGFREILVLAKNPEAAIYTGMYEVRPGQVVRVNRNGLAKRRYWTLTAREHEDDLPRTIKTVAELLEDIVRRQMVSDVPLCSLLFGGYAWFHDRRAVDAATFPWLVTTGGTFKGTQVLDPDLLERLNLPEFEAESYAQAIAETPILKGEDGAERRMRELSYLHLTRF